MSRTRTPQRIVSLLISTVVALTACSFSADGDDSSASALPATPSQSADGREPQRVTDLAQAIGFADLVVTGHVVDVVADRQLLGDDPSGLAYRIYSVDIDVVIAGATSSETVRVEEMGWKDGDPTSLNASEFANVGDEVLLILVRKSDTQDEVYRLVSTQTRFFLKGNSVRDNYVDELVHDESWADPMSAAIDGWTRDALISEIKTLSATYFKVN